MILLREAQVEELAGQLRARAELAGGRVGITQEHSGLIIVTGGDWPAAFITPEGDLEVRE